MESFQKECLERLVRLELQMTCLQDSLKGWQSKVMIIASTLGGFVAAIIAYFK